MSYIDDLLRAEIGVKARESFDTMYTLLRDLNIPISKSKLTPTTTKIVCLGIQVDSENATLSIPYKSFVKLQNFTRKQLQSILGSLMFVHKVVKPARYFVNKLLHTLRIMKQDKVPMTEDIQKDINWFLAFGGRFNNLVYTYQFQNNEIPSMFTIVHFEMWNVLVALRLWGPMWKNKHILLRCDETVVSVVNTGVTKNNGLAALARNIWLETALRDIQLKLVHVKGGNWWTTIKRN